MENTFKILMDDHRKVDALFREIESLEKTNVEQCQRLARQLKQELEIHTAVEEQVLYPACKKYEQMQELVETSIKDHGRIRSLLQQIERLAPSDEAWISTIRELKAEFQEHIEAEESELFPETCDAMSEEQLSRLGETLQQVKAEHVKAIQAST